MSHHTGLVFTPSIKPGRASAIAAPSPPSPAPYHSPEMLHDELTDAPPKDALYPPLVAPGPTALLLLDERAAVA